ncbi:sperm flagellar protein 1 isoform 2-T2 [Synchiropus picturatus]
MTRVFNLEALQDLYAWIDRIPLSRPKRNITRDFSDGVMAAEVVKYFFPNLVDLHNYTPASSTQQKLSNWNLLNRKVFAKLQYNISDETMRKIVLSTSGAIEPVLIALRDKIEKKMEQSSDNKQDLEYFDTRSQEKVLSDHRHTEMTREDMKKFRLLHQTSEGTSNHESTLQSYAPVTSCSQEAAALWPVVHRHGAVCASDPGGEGPSHHGSAGDGGDPSDESEPARTPGSVEEHAHRGPHKTFGNVQNQRMQTVTPWFRRHTPGLLLTFQRKTKRWKVKLEHVVGTLGGGAPEGSMPVPPLTSLYAQALQDKFLLLSSNQG